MTRLFKLETCSVLLTLFPLFAGFFAVTVFARPQRYITNMNILDLQQAAKLLQINPESLRRLAFRGAIPARKPGRKWLFVEEHLEEWLKGDYAASGEMAHKRGELCPSTNEKTAPTTGSTSQSRAASRCRKALGLQTGN
jgi:excisionase family DNA binding protein